MLKEKYLKDQYLKHHGIKGQKWGRRRFQDNDGKLTTLGKLRYGVGTGADASKSDGPDGSSAKSGGGRGMLVPRNTSLARREEANIIKGKSGVDGGSKTNDQNSGKTKFGGREGEVVKDFDASTNPRNSDNTPESGQNGAMVPRKADNSSKGDGDGSASKNNDFERREKDGVERKSSNLSKPTDGHSKGSADNDSSKSDSKPEPINGGKNQDRDRNDKKHRSDPDSDIESINKKDKERFDKEITDTKTAVTNITSGTDAATKGMSNMIDAIQKIQRSNSTKHSNVKVMTDAEIRRALDRMDLEQRYNRAKYGGEAMTGAEKAKAALTALNSAVATIGGIAAVALTFKQLFGNR